jgi:hypothetical protein
MTSFKKPDPLREKNIAGKKASSLSSGERELAKPVPIALKSETAIHTKVPLSNSAVLGWLQRAVDSGEDVYGYLSQARNTYRIDKYDSNLTAAERYMEGYNGNYNDTMMLGQHILKQVRTVPYAEKILGKNGSPAADSAFVTKWGMIGNMHREENMPLGGTTPIIKSLKKTDDAKK